MITPPALLDEIRNRIRARLNATGLSANEASRRAGAGLTYVNDLLSGKSKNPSTLRLRALADVLECDLEFLTGLQDMARAAHSPATVASPVQPDTSAVWIYHVPMTDPDGFFPMEEEAAGMMHLSFLLEPGAGTYAVAVGDDSMAPRYLPGEIVCVNPRKAVGPGACVVVRLRSERAIIRQVAEISSTEIKLRALKTGEVLPISREDILQIHKIVLSFEG